MTKEEFKAFVSMAYDGREKWEQFLERVWQLHVDNSRSWVSVEDELPPNNGGFSDEVLTYHHASKRYAVAMFCYISNCWFGCDDTVTHWMPMPEQPAKLSNLERTGKNEL